MPSEAHCQADRGINAEFSRKILDRSVTILLDKNKSFEDASILISTLGPEVIIINISDIDTMELSEND